MLLIRTAYGFASVGWLHLPPGGRAGGGSVVLWQAAPKEGEEWKELSSQGLLRAFLPRASQEQATPSGSPSLFRNEAGGIASRKRRRRTEGR